MTEQARLNDLLLLWETAREEGHPLTVEELCADWQEGIPALRQRVQMLERLEPVLDLRSEAVSEPRTGATWPDLPHYVIESELGRGGMGVVYLARDKRLPRHVAVKVLSPRFGLSPVARQRFIREAEVLAQLQHDHIVPILEAELQAETPYFVMGYVAGGSLDRCLAQYRGRPRAAVTLIEAIARAVHHAHMHGVLHRDLKPGNILIDSTGKPLVSDFGIARLSGQTEPAQATISTALSSPQALTGSGSALGTPSYMAPEQRGTTDAGELTPASDVWALGIILHEMVTGVRPFAHQPLESARTTVEQSSLVGEPVLHPLLDAGLAQVLRRCLERDPAQRYSTTRDLADELAHWRSARQFSRLRLGIATVAATVALLLMLPLLLRLRASPTPLAETANERNDRLYAEALWEYQAKLARGQAISFIPATPTSLPTRWKIGQGDVMFEGTEGAPGAVRCAAMPPSLLELLPDPGIQHYRISVEMRQDLSYNQYACAGLYVSHSAHATPKGLHHFFTRMSFGDLGIWGNDYKDPRGNPEGTMHLDVSCIDGTPGKSFGAGLQQNHGLRYPALGRETHPSPWHHVQIEVHPTYQRLHLNGQSVDLDPVQSVNEWLPHLMQNNPDLKDIVVTPSPRGGFGIWIYSSVITIRTLRIEPLSQP